MKTRIVEISVGELARLSGVSVRTLHHYDDIGLLRPAHVAANGYRHYGHAEILRLQEILFYRDAALSLREIDSLLASPQTVVDRLIAHRDRLSAQSLRTAEIIATLNATIAHLNGERDMALNDLYKPFTAQKQAAHETWLIETYGPDMAADIERAKAAINDDPKGFEAAMATLRETESQLVELFETGTDAGAPETHVTLEQHRAFVTHMWAAECGPDAYCGLADLYSSHADFAARYETLSPRFSGWLPKAMKAHAARLRESGKADGM